jgi:rhodanese-related sulfurtransferase
MFTIKANPLRVSTVIFTAIIIILMLIRKFIPANYTVAVENSLLPEIWGNEVTLQELHGLLQQEEKDFLLIDIRTPEEFEAGHLPDAVNIPTPKLLDKKSRKLMKKHTSLLYCSSEQMAFSASYLLRQCGYDTRPVNGNYDIIKTNVVDKFVPSFGFYSEEKQQFHYPDYIKQKDAPQEFQIDKKDEVRIQAGC